MKSKGLTQNFQITCTKCNLGSRWPLAKNSLKPCLHSCPHSVSTLIIVCLSYLNFIPGFGNFTAFRTLRVMKPLRSLNAIAGLKILVTGLFHSFGGLVHVLMLAAFIFCIFGILGVQLWGGKFRKRCATPVFGNSSSNTTITAWTVDKERFCADGAPDHDLAGVACPLGQLCIGWENPKFGYLNFDNVAAGFLVIFQVITFEGWTEVLHITSYVWGRASIIYFFFLIMIGSYFIPNLALAVINDKFNDAQQQHAALVVDEAKKQKYLALIEEKSQIRLRGPNAGCPNANIIELKQDEVPKKAKPTGQHGKLFETTNASHESMVLDSEVISLTELDGPDELSVVIPDPATVSHPPSLEGDNPSKEEEEEKEEEVATSGLLRLRSRIHTFTEGYPLFDPVSQKVYTNAQLQDFDEEGTPTTFTKCIVVAIILNTVFLAIFHFGQPDWVSIMLNIANVVFTVVFAVEMVIRVFALGPYHYVRDPFNNLDGITVIFSIVELALSGSNIVSVFRALRLLRVLKLIKRFPSLRYIIRVALGALEHTLYLNLIMFIYLFIAALAGMQFFGGRFDGMDAIDEEGPVRQHFDTFLRALYSVFQVLTRDDWVNVMYTGMRATNEAAVLYFITIVLIGNYIILSLFLAILISSFREQDDGALGDDIEDEDVDLDREVQLQDIREKLSHEVGEHLNLLPPEDPAGVIHLSDDMVTELEAAQHAQQSASNLGLGNFLLRRNTLLGANYASSVSLMKRGASGISLRPPTDDLLPGTLVPVVCDSCLQEVQEPLETPPLVPAFDATDYHQRHCWIMSIRKSKKNILTSLLSLTQIKIDLRGPFSETTVSTIVEQAHTVNAMTSFPVKRHGFTDWDQLHNELNVELDLLELKVGEEMIGGGLKTYVHAALPKEHHTNGGFALFCLGPKHSLRVHISEFVAHPYFERVILACIMLSCITLAIDNPRDDRVEKKDLYTALFAFDVIFTTIFVVEMLLKIVARGFIHHDTAYLRDTWNVLDCSIVLISIVSLALGDVNIGWIKVFRALRGLRPLRVIQRNRGLKMVVRTLLQSVVGIANVALLSTLNYLIFGILAVQFLGGKLYECTDPVIEFRVNCTGNFTSESGRVIPREWRPYDSNFDNIGTSILTLFEVSVGERWGRIMYNAIDAFSHDRTPVIDHNEYIGLGFIAFFIISNFFLLNLFVGVVISNFNNVKSKMDGLSILSDQQKLWVETQRLMLNFRPHVNIRPGNNKVAKRCAAFVASTEFEAGISVMILLNVVAIALDHYGMNETWELTLQSLNYFFVAVFLVECILKLIAYRHLYFTNGWNRFDFLLVVLSIVGVVLFFSDGQSLPIDPALLRVFRIFRLFRVLRLVKQARHVQVLIETLWYSLPSIGNISIFMLLVYFIFGVLGVQFFAKVQAGDVLDDRFVNFHNFPNAMLLMFVMTTGEDWNGIMHDCMVEEPMCEGDSCGHMWAPIFFVPFMLISAFVISQLFIAIILDNFDTTLKLDQSSLKLHDLHRYVEIWSEFDEDASMVIPTHLFPRLLARLRPPLGISRSYSRVEIITKTLQYRVPEHGGQIHFVETLIPLARAVMKVTFSPREIREHEEMWRNTFPDLMNYPILRYRQECVTVEKYFCSTYIAAAYRRKTAWQELSTILSPLTKERLHPVVQHLRRASKRDSLVEMEHWQEQEIDATGVEPATGSAQSPPLNPPLDEWVDDDRTRLMDF